MKIIRYSLLVLAITSLSSCLKSKNDFGGLRTDNGSIVISVLEAGYLDAGNQALGEEYFFNTSFDFASANEDVKFFNIHVSQPKEAKLSGDLKIKVSMAPSSDASTVVPPAGAITIPTEISFPAFTGTVMDYPVKFRVNKALLDPSKSYAVKFTIESVNQGVVGKLEKSAEVYINNSKYTGRYTVNTTVTDSANVYGIKSNIKPVLLEDNYDGTISFYDFFYGGTTGYATLVNNFANGTTAATSILLYPTFELDATDKLVTIYNTTTGAQYNVTVNPGAINKFVYTANDNRSFTISYTVRLTLTAPGGAGTLNRPFTVTETYTYDKIQAWL